MRAVDEQPLGRYREESRQDRQVLLAHGVDGLLDPSLGQRLVLTDHAHLLAVPAALFLFIVEQRPAPQHGVEQGRAAGGLRGVAQVAADHDPVVGIDLLIADRFFQDGAQLAHRHHVVADAQAAGVLEVRLELLPRRRRILLVARAVERQRGLVEGQVAELGALGVHRQQLLVAQRGHEVLAARQE